MTRLGMVAVLLDPAVARAAEETAEHEGMPQLDFANVLTISQVVWMFIVFAVFYLLLSRWALPQVATVVEHRAASIAADLAAARSAKAESDASMREVAEATRSANAEAQARIATAVGAAKAEAAARAAEANERMDAQLHASEAQIASARKAAMGALRQVASETAGLMVSRLTGRPAEPQLVDTAVGTALAGRPA